MGELQAARGCWRVTFAEESNWVEGARGLALVALVMGALEGFQARLAQGLGL